MNTADYCAALKRRLKIESDYGLAKRLGFSRQRVSNYTNGLRVFDNETAVRVAELLQLDPLRVIADMELERASSPDQRKFWERIKAAAVLAAFYVGAASFGALPAPAQASPTFNNNGIGLHIVRRRWLWMPL